MPATRAGMTSLRGSVEHRVDLALGDALAFELRPVEQELVLALLALALVLGEKALEVLVAHDFGETRHAAFDVLQRLNNLGDALAGNVLERARLEDDHHL